MKETRKNNALLVVQTCQRNSVENVKGLDLGEKE